MSRKYYRGEYVRVKGLESRPDLNGLEGVVLKQIEKRYEVDIFDMPNTFSLLPKRLEYLGQSCVVIGPCDKGISAKEIPIYTSYLKGPSEYEEKQELKSRFGWRSPYGMPWSSDNAQYTDLYVYYDSKSRETVNTLADAVFPAMSGHKCCPSEQVNMPGRKDGIRGSIVVIRQEPPRFVNQFMVDGVQHTETGQRDYLFDRLITHDEFRKMFDKAIKHKGEHSHHERVGRVRKAQEKKENKPTPKQVQLDELSKMFSAKFGPGTVKFHDPDELSDYLPYMGN